MQQLQRSKADCWQLRRSSVMQASHDAVCGLCFRTQACAQLPQRHDGAVQSLQYADLPHAEVLLGILRAAGLWHFVASASFLFVDSSCAGASFTAGGTESGPG